MWQAFTIQTVLKSITAQSWFDAANHNLDLLLSDHAVCERKAAAYALNVIKHSGHLQSRQHDTGIRRDEKTPLASLHHQMIQEMSVIVREEMLHFEQVLSWIDRLGFELIERKPARYGKALLADLTKQDPLRFLDELLFAALIEARSCERFLGLSKSLQQKDLADYYLRLHRAEARHFTVYLKWAFCFFEQDKVNEHLKRLAEREAALLDQHEDLYRFHSGTGQAW
jgi:tRNA 2-(methylsulfanyl)-N6-isopentenyladenosine37 hydroxylase